MRSLVFKYLLHLYHGSRIWLTIPVRDRAEIAFIKKLWITGDKERITIKRTVFAVLRKDMWSCEFKRRSLKRRKKVRLDTTLLLPNETTTRLLEGLWRQRATRRFPKHTGLNPYFTDTIRPDTTPF